MHENIIKLLMDSGVQQLYVTNRAAGAAARKISGTLPSFHCEVSTNEKVAFELALTGAYAAKRTACLFSTEGLYEALDPVMSSAYTGVAGSFLIVAVQENDEEVTPLGLFSKLPLIVTETDDELERAVSYGYALSEEYKIPVIIQAVPDVYGKIKKEAAAAAGTVANKASFKREPGRWAATPRFRYRLHCELNEKIMRISEAFETYGDNVVIRKGKEGLITDRLSRLEFYDENASVLRLATVFPLPEKLVQGFVDEMEDVLVVETYPAIELQIPRRSKVKSGFLNVLRGDPQYEETMQGFTVVRDRLGPASSINMAHGIKKLDPGKNILAVTFEDHFFHSGLPAFINMLYNDSSCVVLITAGERQGEIEEALRGCGFGNMHSISAVGELARFRDTTEPVVVFYRGMI